MQALINRYKAMGGGWVVAAGKMTAPADEEPELFTVPSLHTAVDVGKS